MSKKDLNGDILEGALQKFWYFFQCLRNHQKGDAEAIYLLGPNLLCEGLDLSDLSPSRALCNCFWRSINYAHLERELGSKLHFLDLGCGNGKYGLFLKNWSSSSFGSYTGIDIYKNNDFPQIFEHHTAKAEDAHMFVNKSTNVIISQSALEHVENDIEALELLTRKLSLTNKNFVQIHLVPASASLWLYLFHGWRQYSRKNLGAFAKRLGEIEGLKVSAVPLGGLFSFWTHFRHITLRRIFNKLTQKKIYTNKEKNFSEIIISSVTKELNCRNRLPSFWAFIVHGEDHVINFHEE